MLTTKYRPQRFDQISGQTVVKRILVNSIIENRIHQSLLFYGQKGTGKTTAARIFAKAINCKDFGVQNDACCVCDSCTNIHNNSHMYISEFDAASHSGVDDVRALEDLIRHVPSSGYRVIILDECHMLSKSAQSALLKSIEEPPVNTIFMLVTTDPQKLEDTIRSRCLSVPFRSISGIDIATNISSILQQEGKVFEQSFIDSVVAHNDGSLRDAQQMVDRAISMSGTEAITTSLLDDFAGIISVDTYKDLVAVLNEKNVAYAIDEVNRWYNEGYQLDLIFEIGIPNIVRDLTVYLSGLGEKLKYLTGIPHQSFCNHVKLSLDDVKVITKEWENTIEIMKFTHNLRVIFEMFMVKVCV